MSTSQNDEIRPVNVQEVHTRDVALKQHVLTFDGGGIRGYSSLLILRALMEKIALLEKDAPPNNGVPGAAGSPNGDIEPIPATDDAPPPPKTDNALPLPCHYFDYIVGTSTGGLSAIMLGRLRMDINVCLELYGQLGQRIFGHPRRFHLKGHPLEGRSWWPRSKYNGKKFEKYLQETIEGIIGARGLDGQLDDHFPLEDRKCRTVVVAVMETLNDFHPFLFRSYDNLELGRRNGLGVRNPGTGYNARIWQVARATTAAPGIFSAMNLDGYTFLDGGMGNNNPSKLAYDEVVELHYGEEKGINFPLRLLLNIGTGGHPPQKQNIADTRNKKQRFRYFRILKKSVHRWPDGSEIPHDMRRLVGDEQYHFHCLDVEDGLHTIAMDEWKKNNKTLENIAQHTQSYIDLPETQTTLEDAAKQLVEARQARQHHNHWTEDKKLAFFAGTLCNGPMADFRDRPLPHLPRDPKPAATK